MLPNFLCFILLISFNLYLSLPTHYTSTQDLNEWRVEGFKINSSFTSGSDILEAGKQVSLRVEVEVTRDASMENVMIEIPVPASCSYADKRQYYNGIETHREYFKDRTIIFCENLKPGKYIFLVNLLPRFTGKYILNPAQVSLMYVPVVNANTDLRKVVVEEMK